MSTRNTMHLRDFGYHGYCTKETRREALEAAVKAHGVDQVRKRLLEVAQKNHDFSTVFMMDEMWLRRKYDHEDMEDKEDKEEDKDEDKALDEEGAQIVEGQVLQRAPVGLIRVVEAMQTFVRWDIAGASKGFLDLQAQVRKALPLLEAHVVDFKEMLATSVAALEELLEHMQGMEYFGVGDKAACQMMETQIEDVVKRMRARQQAMAQGAGRVLATHKGNIHAMLDALQLLQQACKAYPGTLHRKVVGDVGETAFKLRRDIHDKAHGVFQKRKVALDGALAALDKLRALDWEDDTTHAHVQALYDKTSSLWNRSRALGLWDLGCVEPW